MKTSALVLCLLGANAKISSEEKAVVAQIKSEIATQNLMMKSASIDQTKVQLVESKVEDLINDVITDVTNQKADEDVLNKALIKKMSTEWPVTNKAVEDAYSTAFDGLKTNFNMTKTGDMVYVKVDNNDSVVSGFKTAYDKDMAAGKGYMDDLVAYDAAVKAAEDKNMDYDGYVKQGKSIKVAVKDAIDSVKTTAQVEDGTTSLVMKTASMDETKLNTVGQEFGDMISDIATDMKAYDTKKQALDKAMWKKMSTEWPVTNKAVENAYESAFDSLQTNFNMTKTGDMVYVKVDNNDSVVSGFKTAYDKDMAAGKGYMDDLVAHDTAVKTLQKNSFNVTQYKQDWDSVKVAADDFKASIKTTSAFDDGATSLVMKSSANTVQEKKVNAAAQAVADAI
jgi:hypothetical protein